MRRPVRRPYARVALALASIAFIGATPAVVRRHSSAQAAQAAQAARAARPAHAALATGYHGSRPAGALAPKQTIVAVGDSITKGDYDSAVKGGWVARLAAKLHGAYPETTFDVRNAGVDGDTTAGVLKRASRDVLAAHPRLVIISIGTNDFDVDVSPAAYKVQLNTLITTMQTGPSTPTIVLASMLPIAGQTPRRLTAERAYNDIIRQSARASNVGYLDLFDPWLALGHTYLHLLRHDTEHPNPIGYELLASTTAAFLEAGYLDGHGRVMAPVKAPTCAIVCDTAPVTPTGAG